MHKNLKILLAFSDKFCKCHQLRLIADGIHNHIVYDSNKFKLSECEPKQKITSHSNSYKKKEWQTKIPRKQEHEENNMLQKTFPQNDKINDTICWIEHQTQIKKIKFWL